MRSATDYPVPSPTNKARRPVAAGAPRRGVGTGSIPGLRRANGELLENVRRSSTGQVAGRLRRGPHRPALPDRRRGEVPGARDGDPCDGIDPEALTVPFAVELIWSYWHEEGGLVQTLNHILARFQNRRTGPGPDPMARFDLSPLRPLRNLLFEWAESEADRLTVRRRAAEYEYEYGLSMVGRAVPRTGHFVESRTTFIQAFHQLLHTAYLFFREEDDTTVNADPFPLLNALRETHLVLAEGAHNQYGDLPTVAREQMLIMQLILASRRCATSSAVARWCRTRRRGWTASTR